MFPPMSDLTERTRNQNETRLLEAEARMRARYARPGALFAWMRRIAADLRCWFAGVRAQAVRRSEPRGEQLSRPC